MMKQIKNPSPRFIFNNKAMSIIEVLVATGLATIVSLGVATMLQNMMIEQKKLTMLAALKEQKSRIESLLRDQNSWNNTINDATINSASTFTSLRNSASVTEVPYTAPIKIILKDAAGNVAMNLIGPAETTGNGFTEKGGACTTFNSAAGSGTDACPLSYKILMAVDCPGSGPCTNPLLKISARLLFNPAPNGVLSRFTALIQTNVGSIDISDSVRAGNYDVEVKRTASQVNRTFSISASKTGSGTDCSGNGAGVCTVSPNIHPLLTASGWVEDDDQNSLVTIAGANIRFNETGIYGCTINVPAFATLGFTAEFRRGGATPAVAQASTTAGLWAASTAVIDTKFNVSSTSDTYSIFQSCDAPPTASPPGDVNVGQCSLGMVPSSLYSSGARIITMTCYKLDRSN